MRRILLIGAVLGLAAPLRAQESPMRRFDQWIGSWTGSGWSVSAAGTRTEFALEEQVQRKVGGTVLLLDGRGTTADGTVTHDGLVVLSHDGKAGVYRWSGYEVGRAAVDAEVNLLDGGLEWSIPAGGATVRITIHIDSARWHEVGEVSTDGTTWTRFMEVNLTRR